MRKTWRMTKPREAMVVFDRDELALTLHPLRKEAWGEAAETGLDRPLLPDEIRDFEVGVQQGQYPLLMDALVAKGPALQNRLPVLDRLTLNISTRCNMVCRYCYAHGGAYYTPGFLMDGATALRAVNFATRRFASVAHVDFFGGEPALNPEVIRLVCEYVLYLGDRGLVDRRPAFGLTTNGSLMPEQLLRMLDTYRFSVTVSLDGPRSIHDLLRTTVSGRGTYDRIARNIGRLRELGIPIEFECTYTLEHERNGWDIAGLLDYFHDAFGCRILHCPTVIGDPGNPWSIPLDQATLLRCSAVKASIRNLARGVVKAESTAVRILNALAARRPCPHFCPAGRSLLAVNADGRVFPCFMLMETSDQAIADVHDDDGRDSGRPMSYDRAALLVRADKSRHAECQACWAQPLCFGCLGDEMARGQEVPCWSSVPGRSPLCDSRREIVETCLLGVAESRLIQAAEPTANGARFRRLGAPATGPENPGENGESGSLSAEPEVVTGRRQAAG